MPEAPRAIIYLDLDAFYAAVEVHENPNLAGKPVVIGGLPAGRGVVAAASYPAREYGIHSAMPMYKALQLCPEAVVIPPRHRTYSDYSRRVMAILFETTPLVEPVSIDEAVLDLTNEIVTWQDCVLAAHQLQKQVWEQVGLSASLGVATNKLVAKVASDRNKPGGITVVYPGTEAKFLAPLPVRVLWGVGPVTAQKLAALGITLVGQLAQLPEPELTAIFGKHGRAMARQAQGIDRRSVQTHRAVKSVSQERTFSHNVADLNTLKVSLWRMSKGVAKRLHKADFAAGTISIKLRYSDFDTLTRQMALSVPIDDEIEIYRAALVLLERYWTPGRPVRLLGVSGQRLSSPRGQLSFWSETNKD